MATDSGRVTGSHASHGAAKASPPVGFDPARLCRDMADLLLECPRGSFVAADLTWSRPGPTGNALARLAQRGLLIRASDPEKWGRSRYRLSPLGSAVQQRLQSERTGA